MSDFITAIPDIDAASVQPLYLRPATILVRPGNPNHISGLADLLKPGHRILVVNGAGQQGLWEDVAGRLGDIGSVRALRSNIVKVAGNSAQAKQVWTEDTSIDAWLIWSIWQVANSKLADQVAIEPQYAIYRDTGIALTKRGHDHPRQKSLPTSLPHLREQPFSKNGVGPFRSVEDDTKISGTKSTPDCLRSWR